jgi:hypothetical protein
MNAFKITNGNCYLENGTLAGKAEEVEIPEIKLKMVDYKALGMLSDIEIPGGYEKMEVKVKFKTLMLREFALLNPNKTISLIVRGNLEQWNNKGKAADNGVKIAFSGVAKNFPHGKLQTGEMSDITVSFTCWSIKTTIGGRDIMEFDAFSNTYKINGDDVNAAWKINS